MYCRLCSDTGALFYLTTHVTTWLRPLYMMAGSGVLVAAPSCPEPGSLHSVKHTAANSMFSLSMFIESAGNVSLWLTDASHIQQTHWASRKEVSQIMSHCILRTTHETSPMNHVPPSTQQVHWTDSLRGDAPHQGTCQPCRWQAGRTGHSWSSLSAPVTSGPTITLTDSVWKMKIKATSTWQVSTC